MVEGEGGGSEGIRRILSLASLPRGGGEGGLGRMQDRSRRMAGLASPSNTLRSPGPLTRPAARDRAFFGGGAVDRGWVGGGAVGERRDGIHRARAADVAAGPAAGRTHPAELSVRGRHVGVFGGEKEGNKGACLMMHWSDMSTARPRLRLFVGRHGVVKACRVKRLRPATHPYSPPGSRLAADAHSGSFFVPCVWAQVVCESGIAWDLEAIRLFRPKGGRWGWCDGPCVAGRESCRSFF